MSSVKSEMPVEIRDFFKRQPHLGLYIPYGPDISSGEVISYESLKGDNATEPPSGNVFGHEAIEYPFTNKDRYNRKQADSVAKYIIRRMHSDDIETRELSNIEKAYMLNGGSRPIKVRFNVNDSSCRTPLYVKKPDPKRIFGLFVYNLINGMDQTEFGFNEGMIVEKEISGTLLSQIDETALMYMPEYREGLVRAAVHMDFLCSTDTQKHNRIIGESYKTILLDFDDLFLKINSTKNPLLQAYHTRFQPTPEETEMMIDEQSLVLERIADKYDLFMDFIEHSRDIRIRSSYEDRDGTQIVFDESLDERIQKHFNAPNLREFYTRKLESYSSNRYLFEDTG